jgi:cytochrome d ubiquinol oxidase subunit I
MDVEILARLQFALTIMFHYIYPPLSMGLGVVIVISQALYLLRGEERYKVMAKFWTKVFALTFAVGVATGIVMEFEFGTNWATYSRFVGDVFGGALAAEGIFAFFLESGFLALLIFGWDRIGKKLHFFASLMVCLGAHFSAIWIVVANSWMQTPAGYHIVGEGLSARAEIVDFWAMVFSPSSLVRLSHVIVGTWLAGAFLVISIASFYLLKKRHLSFAKTSLKIALPIALVSCILQVILGDMSGKIVAKYQPLKLAAFEGVFETTKGAPLAVFGLVNTEKERIDYALKIPKLLSFLAFNDPEAEVIGLKEFPKKDWPKTAPLFQIYRIMLGSWVIMFSLSLWSLILWFRGTLFTSRKTLWALTFSVLAPQIGNQAGWIASEMGRYPWIVYNLLRISDGLSKAVVASQVLGSIIMFGFVYVFLFIMFIYLLNEKIQHGPEDGDGTPYHNIEGFVRV